MTAGFPEGTPLRRASNFTYNHFARSQFLRTTYKAGPLVALGLAVLGGAASTPPGAGRCTGAVAAVALALVAAGGRARGWPLVRGRALDDQLALDLPPAWRSAAAATSTRRPDASGAVVLPGQLYAYYDWGGTIDPILPALTDQPVTHALIVPYADLRATDLLWTVDALVQQAARCRGSCSRCWTCSAPATVVARADDDRTRSGEAPCRRRDPRDARPGRGTRRARRWGPCGARACGAGTSRAACAAARSRAGTARRRRSCA